MRSFFIAAVVALIAPFAPQPGAAAESLELLGQSGILGEWELTATVTATGGRREFSGPIVLKHTGVCSAEGPETRSGEMRLQLIGASRVRASLTIDGSPCSYSATKSDAYVGMMSCRDKRDVPLRLWVK
jgi:hypothetical protein